MLKNTNVNMEKLFPRDIFPMLIKWLERREAYVIKGPRQSGKTTILKILKEKIKRNVVFLNFEDPDVLEAFETAPKEYIQSFLLTKAKYYFLMDEYHYVKEPGKKLKLLYDIFENVKFILTGSSSLELKEAMAKFLVGRVFFFELFPFNFHEFLVAKELRLGRIYEERNKEIREFLFNNKIKIKKDIFLKEFSSLFNEYVIFGGYPAVLCAKDKETKRFILKNIYDTYISKDIIEFLKFSDVFRYRNVVKRLAILVGGLVNYNDICSECQTYYKELRKILSMLTETYIIKLIQPFHMNPTTELKKIPKIYFFDLGLRNYVINNFNHIEKRVDKGVLVENFVFLSLKNFSEEINYWRTIGKAEVDFVIKVGEETIPIEVKFQKFQKPKISRSLRNFIKTYKPKKALVATNNFWYKAKIDGTTILFAPVFYL